MKKLVNLRGAKVLNKNEQKTVIGGYIPGIGCGNTHCRQDEICCIERDSTLGDGPITYYCDVICEAL